MAVKRRTKIKFRYANRIILLIIIAATLGKVQLQPAAQTPTFGELEPIFGGGISGAEWTEDSKFFVFYPGSSAEVNASTSQPWFVFDASMRMLATELNWPFKPDLTSQELQAFGLTPENYQVGDPLYFLSPDGHTLVFARQVDCGEQACLYHLILGDRRTGEFFDTNTDVHYPFDLNAFRILWNKAGTAFVIVQTEEFGVNGETPTTYVSGYSSGIANAISTTQIASPVVNGKTWKSTEAFMFSSNNEKLLISAIDPVTKQKALIVYDLVHPLQSIQIPDQYGSSAIAAGYAPNSQENLLLFNSAGLMQYNLITQGTIILNQNLRADSIVKLAWFSPDGERFALVDRTYALFVTRLSTQFEDVFTSTPSTSSSITPTNIPTFTPTKIGY